MIKVPRQKTEELKQMISEGLHIFGRAMSVAEQMCEDAQMGERNYDYPYGERMGMRDNDYMGERHYPQYPMMGERDYDPYMGERRGVRGTGRYSRY